MKATVQMISLILVFILGTFLGVDSAEKNIQQMQGTEGATKAIQITPQENGKIEIQVLGKVVETKNPVNEESQKKMVEVAEKVKQESNKLAGLGNQLGTSLSEITRGILETITGR